MELNKQGTALTLMAGIALLPISAQALLSNGVPTITCPMPLPLVIPAMLALSKAAVAVPTIAFCLWSRSCFHGSPIPRRRTGIGFAIVALGSIWLFVSGWQYSFDYHGYNFTFGAAIVSLGFVAVIGTLLLRRATSLPYSIFVNFLLFVWTFTYAFPYLGELP
jgi:hypothetical protein